MATAHHTAGPCHQQPTRSSMPSRPPTVVTYPPIIQPSQQSQTGAGCFYRHRNHAAGQQSQQGLIVPTQASLLFLVLRISALPVLPIHPVHPLQHLRVRAEGPVQHSECGVQLKPGERRAMAVGTGMGPGGRGCGSRGAQREGASCMPLQCPCLHPAPHLNWSCH